MAGNRPGRGRFGRARSCTEGSGGKSWNARRGGRGVCVCDLGWGRSKVAPSPPAETRLSALFPSRHPIGGGGGGGGGPPLETGPQLRTHRATASLPLPPPDSWCARVCLCVCVRVCVRVVSPEINARVNVMVATELHLGAGSPGFGLPSSLRRSMSPIMSDDLDNFRLDSDSFGQAAVSLRDPVGSLLDGFDFPRYSKDFETRALRAGSIRYVRKYIGGYARTER